MKIPPPRLPPFAVCFKSILSKTAGNIWTYLIIGCLAFFSICLWFLTIPDTHIQFQMIAVTLMVLALAAIVVLLWDKLYRPLRAGIFSCIGLNVTETSSTTMMDLPPPRHRKLAAELDREIFLFLKPAAQRKFIWGLNWDFYAMFRYRLLTKTKRVRNPHGNGWNNTTTTATIAADGLNVSITNGYPNVFAVQAFPISGPLCRADEFPGTILYYYEIKGDFNRCFAGLSGVSIPGWIGPNSYGISIVGHPSLGCLLAGERHPFDLPEGTTRPGMQQFGNVYGCGLVLDPDNNLAIFFTLNGQLLGRKMSISPTVDRLFPAVIIVDNEFSFEANFGDDPAKPFEYDINTCPGLELTCV